MVLGRDAAFRLKRDANAATAAFPVGSRTGTTVKVRPGRDSSARLKARHPGTEFKPPKTGPVRHTAGDAVFALGTALSEDDGFPVGDLAEICGDRRRIEERRKTARRFPALDSFRAGNERGVLREPCANFVMIAATRLTTGEIDREINGGDGSAEGGGKGVNFKSAVAAVFQNLETLSLARADAVAETVFRMVENSAALRRRERPGRGCPGRSPKPRGKWTCRAKVKGAA